MKHPTFRKHRTFGFLLFAVFTLPLLPGPSPSGAFASGAMHAPEWPNLLSSAGRQAAMSLSPSSPWHLQPSLSDLEDREVFRKRTPEEIYRNWLSAVRTPPNIQANDPSGDQGYPSADTQAECAVAAFGANVVVAWNDSKGLRTPGETISHFAYSSNGGASFIDGGSVPLLASGDQSYGDCTLGVDANGNFYLSAIYVSGSTSQDVAVHHGRFTGSAFAWDPPVIAVSGATGSLDKPYLCVDPATGDLYVAYTRFTTQTSIEVVRGTSGGKVWSTPEVLDTSASTSGLQGARPVVGPEGNLYVCYQAGWGNLNCDFSSTEGQIKLRRSTNPATLAFDPAIVAGTVQANWGSYWAGNLRESALFFPDAAVDRSGGPNSGNVYVIWNEAAPWTANPASGTTTEESEPNDAADVPTLKILNPGDDATGTISTSSDHDYWKIDVTAGQHILVRLEPQGFDCLSTGSTTLNFQIRLYKGVQAGAGDSILANSNLDQFASEIVFDAPETATYLLRIRNVGTQTATTGTYTIRTRTLNYGSPSPGRDMRDVVVARSTTLGANFEPEVLVNDDAPGLDNCIPAITVDDSGVVSAFFYDVRDSGGARILRSYYRGLSGSGGASFTTNERISDELSYFNLNVLSVPNYGEYNQACSSGGSVYASWSDERLSHATTTGVDAYVAAVQNCSGVVCSADTLIQAGASLERPYCVVNCGSDPMDVTVTIAGALGWCPPAQQTLHVEPGQTACASFTCSVPGTTPSNVVNKVRIVVTSGASFADSCEVALTSKSPREPEPLGGQPESVALLPNQPNPFQVSTHAVFDVPGTMPVDLAVFNTSGRLVRQLLHGRLLEKGRYAQPWDGTEDSGKRAPSGVYIIRMKAAGITRSHVVVLVK